jgi:hypothetical protein
MGGTHLPLHLQDLTNIALPCPPVPTPQECVRLCDRAPEESDPPACLPDLTRRVGAVCAPLHTGRCFGQCIR